MTHNDKTYSLSECFHYEDITRQYCISEGCFNLDTQELIKLAIEDDTFDYANFVIFKRLHVLENLIKQKMEKYGFNFNANIMKDPDYYILEWEDYYEKWVEFYKSKTLAGCFNQDDVDIEDIIEQAARNFHWDVLCYIYFKEEDDLNSFLAREEDEFNREKREKESVKNRKFFII